MDSKQYFSDMRGMLHNSVREFHRIHGIRTKKQRRIARGKTNKLEGLRGGRIAKRLAASLSA